MFAVNLFLIGLGTPEIIMIVAVLFLLFGATRLPQLAKSLGQSRKAFKEGMREAEEEFATEREEKMLNSKLTTRRFPMLTTKLCLKKLVAVPQ